MSSHSLPVLFTAEAQDDFEALRLYSRQEWGEEQEAIYTAALLQALGTIGENPAIGRPRREIAGDLRSYVVRQHIIYYRTTEDALIVMRILHTRRDVRRGLGEAP